MQGGDLPGGSRGLSRASCSGPCTAGHFCPAGSVSSTQSACGSASQYCPPGSPSPLLVPTGRYSTPLSADATRRFSTSAAPAGKFAASGMLYKCPAGRYGAARRNLALNREAVQSSTAMPGEIARAAQAVDGNIAPDLLGGRSCTLTRAEWNPWWRVDLGDERTIVEKVRLFARADAASSFDAAMVGLRHFTASLSNVEISIGNSTDWRPPRCMVCPPGRFSDYSSAATGVALACTTCPDNQIPNAHVFPNAGASDGKKSCSGVG